MKNNNKKELLYAKIILGIFGICGIFFLIGVIIYFLLDKHYPSGKNEIIVIYSSVVGGLCTLFGVILTIVSSSSIHAKDHKYSHEPRFFMPSAFDIGKANRINAYNETGDISAIPNHIFYFQNTDKVEFKLVAICYNNARYKCNPYFVNKNELFSICFHCKGKTNNLYLNIEGLDGTSYIGKVDLAKKYIIVEENK